MNTFTFISLFLLNFMPIFGSFLYPLCGRSPEKACFETVELPWTMQLEESVKKVEEEETRIESIISDLLELVGFVLWPILDPFEKAYDNVLEIDPEKPKNASFYLFILFVLAIYVVVFYYLAKYLSHNYSKKLKRNYYDKVRKVLRTRINKKH